MNELQLSQLATLDESFAELKESVLDEIDPTMLALGINYHNPIAIDINTWNIAFHKYYYDKKKEIIDNPDTIIDINFDNVGLPLYDNMDLSNSLKLYNTSEYKIAPYVDKPFTDSKINQVDFKRDLKADIVLNKKVIRIPNGRPEKSEYYLDGVLMAVIHFVFETNSSNLITKRTEILNYIKNDGSEGVSIKIKEKIYDLTDPGDAALAIKERIDSRKYLMDSIMVFINGVLQQVYPDKTQYQIITMITPYWDYSQKQRDDFVNLGLEYWEEDLINMVDVPSEYSWLAFPIDENGTTVKDYIISVISY